MASLERRKLELRRALADRRRVELVKPAASGFYYFVEALIRIYTIYEDRSAQGTTAADSNTGHLGGMSISTDEKTLYASGDGTNGWVVGRAVRTSTTTPFGPFVEVSELDGPHPNDQGFGLSWASDDECVAYGFRLGLDGHMRIVRATRGQ